MSNLKLVSTTQVEDLLNHINYKLSLIEIGSSRGIDVSEETLSLRNYIQARVFTIDSMAITSTDELFNQNEGASA